MLYSLLAPLLVTSPSPLEPLRPPLDARADIDTANARAEIRIQLKNGATIKHITHQYKHPDFNADSYSIQPDVGMKPNNKKYYYREQLDPWGKKAEGTLPPLGEAEYNGVKGQRVDTYLTVLAGNKKMRCEIHRANTKSADGKKLLNKDTAQKKPEAFIIYDKPSVWDPALSNTDGPGVVVKDGNVYDQKEVKMTCKAWVDAFA